MIDLSSKYLGLNLKNPLIAGSTGLTNSIANIKEIAKKGAGAVVLKSLFEEQIRHETEKMLASNSEKMQTWNQAFDDIVSDKWYAYDEAFKYISDYAKEHTLNEYLKFIEEAKKSVDIPVIASINCISQYEWQYFAKKIQEAGADALELNVYVLPSDVNRTIENNENIYFEIVNEVKKYVSIPVSLKIGYYFSSLAQSVEKISKSGINGIVLFNRPYTPDINIYNFDFTPNNIYSTPSEYAHTLRWVGILSGRLGCDISASTGIHNHEILIKMLLAGANTAQIASILYRNGFDEITNILQNLEVWMNANNFSTIDEFRGKLSMKNVPNPASFERVQFMKLYSKIE